MDINTETEIKQKHSLTPFPVFLISPAFRGRYFHSYFRSSAMNAYYIQDRLEAQSWARHYQQLAREEKEAELADDMETNRWWSWLLVAEPYSCNHQIQMLKEQLSQY